MPAPVLRKHLAPVRSLTGPRDKTIRLTSICTSLPDRSGHNRGIRVRGGDESGTDRNQRVLPPTHSSRCKRKAPTVPPVQHRNWGDAIRVQRLLTSSCPSRGDPSPPVLVMEAAENHASHNLAVLGKGMFVVILQRWEYRGTFRNPRSEAQMRAPLVVMSNPF